MLLSKLRVYPSARHTDTKVGYQYRQLELWHKKNANINIKEDLLNVYSDCSSDIFANIKKLLQIFITLPITIATSERSFSNLKFLKNYLRSSTSESRLNGLANLYISRDISVTPEEVFDKIAKLGRRIILV
nr:unnamed protein product [Callosobruchus analis]